MIHNRIQPNARNAQQMHVLTGAYNMGAKSLKGHHIKHPSAPYSYTHLDNNDTILIRLFRHFFVVVVVAAIAFYKCINKYSLLFVNVCRQVKPMYINNK